MLCPMYITCCNYLNEFLCVVVFGAVEPTSFIAGSAFQCQSPGHNKSMNKTLKLNLIYKDF